MDNLRYMPAVHDVYCHNCHLPYNALDAQFCYCITKEPTTICPHCSKCFCDAPREYRDQYWTNAPQALRERKWEIFRSPVASSSNPEPNRAKHPLVLVVDDDKNIRRMAAQSVTALGYGVIVAEDGAAGLALAKRYLPELVLTDALMPKLDGREMCRMLKSEPSTSSIKVVVMTDVYTAAKYKTEAIHAFRADDYLAKPLQFGALQELLKRLLG
jgi:CheY-like chemotaxis protein